MIRTAIKKHFEIERELLTKEIKIKPLTLFFIDDIKDFRGEDSKIKNILKEAVLFEAQKLHKEERNEFYREY